LEKAGQRDADLGNRQWRRVSQASFLEGEEAKGKHAERDVMMPADPGADLVVVQSDLTLCDFEDLLDVVPASGNGDQVLRVRRRACRRADQSKPLATARLTKTVTLSRRRHVPLAGECVDLRPFWHGRMQRS